VPGTRSEVRRRVPSGRENTALPVHTWRAGWIEAGGGGHRRRGGDGSDCPTLSRVLITHPGLSPDSPCLDSLCLCASVAVPRRRHQLRVPSAFLKGETPVIYFYTRQRQSVSVHVAFPRGIWTQWYPQAQTVGPDFVATGSPPQLRDGHITWNAEVIPAGPGSDP